MAAATDQVGKCIGGLVRAALTNGPARRPTAPAYTRKPTPASGLSPTKQPATTNRMPASSTGSAAASRLLRAFGDPGAQHRGPQRDQGAEHGDPHPAEHVDRDVCDQHPLVPLVREAAHHQHAEEGAEWQQLPPTRRSSGPRAGGRSTAARCTWMSASCAAR